VVPAVWLGLVAAWLGSHFDAAGGRPLVVLWSDDPGSFDPHATSHPVAQDVFRHVCEPLFYEDPPGTLRGLLAEDDFRFAPDGRTVTVTLRSGIAFHDGAPLAAAAVAASFRRLVAAGVSPLTGAFRDVTVEPISESEVRFHLPDPDYEFPRLVLANPYAAIVSPRSGPPGDPSRPAPTSLPSGSPATRGLVACTGPYRFVPELDQPGQSVTLVRDSRYRHPRARFVNRGTARVPRLVFRFVDDHEARFRSLVSGAGCVVSVEPEERAELQARGGFRMYDVSGGVTYLGFNFQRPAWQDVRNRQAVALAVDADALAADGPFLVADSPLAPNAVGYARVADPFERDRALAASRRLLAETGLSRGSDLVLLVPESRTYARLTTLLLAQLAEAGLTNVRVETRPRADILSERVDFDLLFFDYAWGDYTALAIFLGPGPRNLLGYAGSDVADLVQRARATRDGDERGRLVRQAQERVLDDVLWRPLLVRRLAVAVNAACVTGEQLSPEGELLFHDAVTSH
jgi:peptide/nickel transport system substrate-binding protein